MAKELTITPTTNAATNGTWTLTGNWELRAGSQDTEEWLGTDYPGDDSLTTSFGAKQADAATGYDPGPKLALVALTGGSNGAGGNIATLSGGCTTILSVMVTSNESTEVLHGATWSGLVLTVHGLADTKTAHVMVMYN